MDPFGAKRTFTPLSPQVAVPMACQSEGVGAPEDPEVDPPSLRFAK